MHEVTDCVPALKQFFGRSAGLPTTAVTRLTVQWQADRPVKSCRRSTTSKRSTACAPQTPSSPPSPWSSSPSSPPSSGGGPSLHPISSPSSVPEPASSEVTSSNAPTPTRPDTPQPISCPCRRLVFGGMRELGGAVMAEDPIVLIRRKRGAIASLVQDIVWRAGNRAPWLFIELDGDGDRCQVTIKDHSMFLTTDGHRPAGRCLVRRRIPTP